MIKGLLFDLNGTVIDIYTSESDWDVYRTVANFLDSYGVKIYPDRLKEEYFYLLKEQKEHSKEKFPEFDVVKLFRQVIEKYSIGGKLPDPALVAMVFRAAGRYKLGFYSGVWETLKKLSGSYRMAAVSDGQKIWAEAEFKSLKLGEVFEFAVISGEHGFRKPDPRMYEAALKKLHMKASEVIFIGNDMYRDIYGAHQMGMKTVFFHSNQGEQDFCGAEADYVIYEFPELLKAIEFLQQTM